MQASCMDTLACIVFSCAGTMLTGNLAMQRMLYYAEMLN